MERKSEVYRKTKETDIKVTLNLDGQGMSDINTGIPFFDHMLILMTAHGFLDLNIACKGDIEVDYHHTIEDLGICLGTAIKEALKGGKGIKRYGNSYVPMDESLARVVIDISNRPFLAYRVSSNSSIAGNFDIQLLKEFFRALAVYSGMTIHIDLISGDDAHHIAEAIFKAFAKSFDEATIIESRLNDSVPSTKGIL